MELPIYYSDISKIGKDFTGKKDIAILTNEQALTESIKNILSTEPGERVMNPKFGCSLGRYLFEPIDAVTSVSLKKSIEDAIRQFESRVDNLKIIVTPNEDQNTYDIDIIYNMKTVTNEQKLKISLNKIR